MPSSLAGTYAAHVSGLTKSSSTSSLGFPASSSAASLTQLEPVLGGKAGVVGRAVLLRSYRNAEWPQWFAAAGIPAPPVTGPVFDSSVALAELAADGFGVALLPVAMFSRQIRQGRLVRPFTTAVSAGRYFLAWPSERPQSRAMAAFTAWISDACRDAAEAGRAGRAGRAGQAGMGDGISCARMSSGAASAQSRRASSAGQRD